MSITHFLYLIEVFVYPQMPFFVLERIDEIERVINTDTSKKTKWEKIKPVLIWIADKSYDLGKTILPLLLKIQE